MLTEKSSSELDMLLRNIEIDIEMFTGYPHG